jgi:uncharacterized membrane protein YwzB
MFLSFNYTGIIYTCVFCIFFFITFLILSASRLEECFKKGKTWQIRGAYIFLSFAIATLMTMGIMELVRSFLIN